jgi:hypothetical protein
MNMISTGTFLNGMDASNKQSELVKKLVAAWEKKNSKAARAGGVSLMALSLAACGGEDTTPFAQSDIDAATAPLTAAVSAAETALTAAQADAAGALVAQLAAETQAAEALVAAATAQAATAAAQADAAAATVAGAAATASAQADAAAATAATATATAAKAAAEASLATAQTALATANAEKATLQTTYDALVASNATLQTNYDALVAPKTLTMSTSATVSDALIGATGNDVITAPAGSFQAGDSVVDASTTDSDTINVTQTAAGTMGAVTLTNIENINIDANSLGLVTVDATNFTGASALNVTRGDVVVGGATLTGNKEVEIDGLNGAEVTSVKVNGTATAVSVAQATKAGATIDAGAASSNITIVGASTVTADSSTGNLSLTGLASAVEDAKDVSVNAANAIGVYVNSGFDTDGSGGALDADEAIGGTLTGALTVNAAAAATITVANATGGATINSSKQSADITVAGIDASGATINAGAGISTNDLAVNLTGVAATTTAVDTATVNASGTVTIDTSSASDNPINTLNVGGNGAAITATIISTNSAAGTINKVGTQTVTVAGNVSEFTGATVAGVDVIDLTAGTGAVAASLWTPGKVDLGYDAGAAVTVASGQTWELTFDQTGIDYNFVATSTAGDINIVAGDDNGTSTAVGTITVGAFDAAAAATVAGTLNIEASIANFTATSVTVGTLQNIVVTGDEDVNFGATALAGGGATTSLTAANSTGIITAKVGAAMPTVVSGSGADVITADDAGTVHSITTNTGNDTINITNTAATSVFSGGDGTDTFNVDDVDNIVVVGGAGADTFNTDANLGGQLIGGDGSDTLVMDADASTTFAATFRMSSVDNLNMAALTSATGVVTMGDESFASNNTMVITGPVTSKFKVAADAAAASTIDASGITLASSTPNTLLEYAGNTKADTITGGIQNETILHSIGADVIDGGLGTDTVSIADSTVTPTSSGAASLGAVINLGSTAINSVDVYSNLTVYTAAGASVAANSLSYNFAANLTTNLAETQSLTSIENITAGDGKDYIIGSAGNNTLDGAGAVDYIDGGDGNDTITGGTGADILKGGLGDDTIIAENTDTNLDGGGGTGDIISIAVDANFSTDTFTGFEIATMASDAEITLDIVDIEALTAINGVAAGADEKVIGVGTTGNDTLDLSDTTFSGGAFADIDLAAGIDSITVGTSITAVQLGGSDNVKDTVIMKTTSGVTTITEFASGVGATKDDLNVDNLASGTATVTATGALTVAAGVVYFISGDLNDSTATLDATLLADINGAATFTDADATAYIVLTDTGTTDSTADSALYKWVDTAASANEAVSAELTLMATVDSVLVAGDLIFA